MQKTVTVRYEIRFETKISADGPDPCPRKTGYTLFTRKITLDAKDIRQAIDQFHEWNNKPKSEKPFGDPRLHRVMTIDEIILARQ